MKYKIYLTLTLLPLITPYASADSYIIDPIHSSTWFRVLHLNISPTYGAFPEPEGIINYNPEHPEKSTVEIKIDVGKVTTLNPKRDEHLKSEDFLDVKNFPTATFKGKIVKKLSDSKYKGVGILNFRGIEKEIEFEAWQTGSGKGRQGEDRLGFEAIFTINRSDFGMTEYPPPQISNEVKITVALEAQRPN